MSVGLIYVGQFKEGEEFLGDWPWIRIQSPDSLNESALQAAEQWILRSKRLTLSGYCLIADSVQRAGARLVTSDVAYAIISSLRTVPCVLHSFIPPMVAASASEGLDELISRIVAAKLTPPLFVRSEIESAAKYVGIDGCIAPSARADDIRGPVDTLQREVAGSREIAIKESWQIKKLGTTEIGLEYRSVGYRGKLFTVDKSKRSLVPRLEPFHLKFLSEVFVALSNIGADGLHVIDVAFRASDRKMFVVEWKDASSSSFENPASTLSAIMAGIESD